MSSEQRNGLDVVVVGGGIVGLFVAWRARERGLSVAVLDAGDDDGVAWPVAAGMLAPISEAQFGAHGERAVGLGSRPSRRGPRPRGRWARRRASTRGCATPAR